MDQLLEVKLTKKGVPYKKRTSGVKKNISPQTKDTTVKKPVGRPVKKPVGRPSKAWLEEESKRQENLRLKAEERRLKQIEVLSDNTNNGDNNGDNNDNTDITDNDTSSSENEDDAITKPEKSSVKLIIKKSENMKITDIYKIDNFQPFSDVLINESPLDKPITQDLFEYKYIPETLSSFIGNRSIVKMLQTYISSLKIETPKQLMAMIYGPSGIGKSILANLALKEYNVISFDYSNTSEKNTLFDELSKIINSSSIEMSFLKGKLSSIIIENIEKDIGDGANYTKLLSLLEVNLTKSKIPVIAICSDKFLKKRYATPSKILLLELKYPDITEMIEYCKTIIANEQLLIGDTELIQLINGSKYDFRKILHNIKMLSLNYTDKQITKKEVQRLLNFSEPDACYSAYEMVDEAYNDGIPLKEFDEILGCSNSEQGNITDLLYSTINTSLNLTDISDMYDSISHGNLINRYVFSNQEWELKDYAVISSCLEPYSILNSRKNKKPTKVKKNQLNNLPLLKSKNESIFTGIKSNVSETLRMHPDDYAYSFKNIQYPAFNDIIIKLGSTFGNSVDNTSEYSKLRGIIEELVKSGYDSVIFHRMKNLVNITDTFTKKQKKVIDDIFEEFVDDTR
jgi:hypothetical protein